MKSIRLDGPGLLLIFIVPLVLLAIVNVHLKLQGKESDFLFFTFVLTAITFVIYSVFLYLQVARINGFRKQQEKD